MKKNVVSPVVSVSQPNYFVPSTGSRPDCISFKTMFLRNEMPGTRNRVVQACLVWWDVPWLLYKYIRSLVDPSRRDPAPAAFRLKPCF